jgi:Secreted repeat of unknown function
MGSVIEPEPPSMLAPGTTERTGLSRRQALPLAVGSIAGSGILFLPSAVYVEAGRNSLLVWLLATAACLPMLLMFEDMVGVRRRRSSGTTKRNDGRRQVTYRGHPLYRFAQDAARGQTNGEGLDAFGGEWYVVSPAGTKIVKEASGYSGYRR